MSLLQTLSYAEHQKGLKLTLEQCELIAKLANVKKISFKAEKPGEQLLKTLDRLGLTAQQYRDSLEAIHLNTISDNYISYKPCSKLAILICNSSYVHLSKLLTPSTDCENLAQKLLPLGFTVVIVKDTTAALLKEVLRRVLATLPPESYCLIVYAGHGYELCGVRYILGVDCPDDDISQEHGVAETFLLNCVSKCEPELCVLIMDMCRINLDRETNPKLYSQVPVLEEYCFNRNLLIAYTTQSAMSAYEAVQLDCSESFTNSNMTYELKTGDTERIKPITSQYISALCRHIKRRLPVSEMLDKVHEDLVNAAKKQIPLKVQSGVTKRYLSDNASGDTRQLVSSIQHVLSDVALKEYCTLVET